MDNLSVFSDKLPIGDMGSFSCLVHLVEYLIGPFALLRAHEISVIHAHEFISGITQHPAQRIVKECKVPGNINLIVSILYAIENGSISFLRVPYGLLHPSACGDVPNRASKTNGLLL